jgi:glycerol-3-phosphate dehydrogenase (NAD(P)+)
MMIKKEHVVKQIAVIGDGGWGTTLAVLLSKKGYPVTLWGAFPDYVNFLNKKRINTKFLPGIKIPGNIKITDSLKSAVCNKELVVLAIPSQHMRGVLRRLKGCDYPRQASYLSVTKGIEIGSLKRMSEMIREELGAVRVAALSGPTIAPEVAHGIPSAAVIASGSRDIRKPLQDVFMNDRFRIYTSSDLIGVEMGGSLKNIIAIACGISDGLGFGANTKAALLSRGLAEISRLGAAMGAKAKTFSGISGLGDLVTTCISPYSRNRLVGEQIGKGKSLSAIEAKTQMVAEGVPTTKSAYSLSLKYKVDMPIVQEVYAVLYKQKPPQKAVHDLMTREKREE